MRDTQLPRPAVFLDRDGTIAEEMGYLNHVSRFRMFPFAAAAVRRLNDAGLPVFVVTNQSGVARGYFPESVVNEVHREMQRQLVSAGARVEGVYYCAHASAEDCNCRKPKTGMVERAAREHGLLLAKSYVVGDRYGDIELAHNIGAKGVLVRTGYGEGDLTWNSGKWPKAPDFVAETLLDAADWILEQSR